MGMSPPCKILNIPNAFLKHPHLTTKIVINLSLLQLLRASVNYHVTIQYLQMKLKLELGSMLNVMAALPNIGGALCSTPQFG